MVKLLPETFPYSLEKFSEFLHGVINIVSFSANFSALSTPTMTFLPTERIPNLRYSRERLQCAPAYCAHYKLDMFTVRTSLLWEGNFSRWKWIFYENFTYAFNFYFKKGTDTVRGTLTVRTFLASTVSVPDCILGQYFRKSYEEAPFIIENRSRILHKDQNITP